MFRRIIILLTALALLCSFSPTESSARMRIPKKKTDKQKDDKSKKKSKDKAFKDVIEDYEKIDGLFTFYVNEEEGKSYIAITPEQLGKDYLCTLTRTSGDGSYYDSGADQGEFVFRFNRVGKNIQILEMNVRFRADTSSTLLPAVERGITNSIYSVGKIASAPDDSTKAVLIDASELFVQDILNTSYYLGTRAKLGYSFDSKNSYMGAIKSFPENSEIDVHLHFKTKKPNGLAATLPSPYSMFHKYHYSITGIPETEYVPRIADDRVGYFLTMYQDYTELDHESPYVRYINRWNLKKANPELEISPPVEPITFWLENTIPEEYREYVKEGVLYWNKAFRKAGFEEAIVVKQMPDNADWDPADVRYNVIQWIVFPGKSYAVGPSHANPFTGEIYDADIRVCVDFIRWMFRYSEEFVQPVTPLSYQDILDSLNFTHDRHGEGHYCNYAMERAKDASFAYSLLQAKGDFEDKPELTQKFVKQYIIDLVAHEVGHTLGLRHNFKASTMLSPEQMHDTTLTRSLGMVASTMDYNPANIALPDETQGDYYNLVPGPYDMWAIEYGYKPLNAETPLDEVEALKDIAGRSADPDLVYGTDEDVRSLTGIDPECTQFDLGVDPIEYYERKIVLSNELWKNLEERFYKPDSAYSKLRRIFGWGFGAYSSGAANVSKYIGGIYMERDHIGTPNGELPLIPVSSVRQREAMQFLGEYIFDADEFVFTTQLLKKLQPERMPDFTGIPYTIVRLDYPVHNVVLAIQQNALNQLYNPIRLQRLIDIPLYYDAEEYAFTIEELFSGVRGMIWSEVEIAKDVNSFRRNLQRAHLNRIVDIVLGKNKLYPEDARTLAWVDLRELKHGIKSALNSRSIDTMTRGHLEESLARIDAALEAKLERSFKG
ncbi:MAG: DUF5117 domain-containing protein [candidate division Zixibacteria bacterium]|nr:DUF5117 domain-containing protein [candidate division Zixibacteria bacterium]